ncbi:hypothetical protein [Aquimarina sp. Aq107]|uniref:hypothetical protein n=1 Tax=Aquimarina sp. Aq107 TaxID=1191912 RepID=UPI00131F3535|nr:hypothetical protein [Aquimarina sp. Aq107]
MRQKQVPVRKSFLSVFFLCLFVSSCGSTKNGTKFFVDNEKTNTKISSLKKADSDSVTIKRLLTILQKDYVNIDNESLNNRYLSDTIFGDCIFHKLELAHLYERGDIYLLKNKILNKKIFTEDLMEVLRSYDPVRMENNLLLVPVKENDQEIESTTLYRFKVNENRLELKSVNCIG